MHVFAFNSLEFFIYNGSQYRNVYDTNLAKNNESENSMTPGIFRASKNPTAFLFGELFFRSVVFSVTTGSLLDDCSFCNNNNAE